LASFSVRRSTNLLIAGANNNTIGAITSQAANHDRSQVMPHVAVPIRGAQATAVAMAQVNPDWMSAYRK
jgi:hypothetical protein